MYFMFFNTVVRVQQFTVHRTLHFKIIIMELDNILFANLTFVYKILYVMVPISFNDT